MKALALALPRMTQAEMRQLRDHLTARLSLGGSDEGHEDTRDNVVLRALARVMRRKGFPLPPVIGGKVPASLVHWLAGLNLTLVEEQALLEIGFALVVEDLRAAGAPTTAKTLLRCVVNIPGLIDREFPGYVQIGAIKLVIGLHNRRKEKSHATKLVVRV